MTHLGILLACEHYPRVVADAAELDAQLRVWFEGLGHDILRVSVFEAYEGNVPGSVGDCDVWIVSSAAQYWHPSCQDRRGDLFRFLRGADATGAAIFGIHCGEHAVHAAIGSPFADPPASPSHLRSVRNSYRSFTGSDRLFGFDRTRREMRSLPRPDVLTYGGVVSRWLKVA